LLNSRRLSAGKPLLIFLVLAKDTDAGEQVFSEHLEH
jgi:hypothetical protein